MKNFMSYLNQWVFITPILVVLLSIIDINSAKAFQYPTSAYSATGTNTVSGLTIDWSNTGGTKINGPDPIDDRGYVSSHYTPTIPSDMPAFSLGTNAVVPAGTTDNNIGTFTLTFSTPVRDPILDIAG